MKNYTKDNLLSVDKEILKPGMLALQAGDTTFVLTSVYEKKEDVIVEKPMDFYKCASVAKAGTQVMSPQNPVNESDNGYVISASSTYSSSYPSRKAFNFPVKQDAGWFCNPSDGSPWVQIQFNTAAVVNEYSFSLCWDSDYQTLSEWWFEASNDGIEWLELDNQSSITLSSENHTYTGSINNSTAFTVYRLRLNKSPYSYIGVMCFKLCNITTSDTWTGYKAVLTDGVYRFEEAVTEGLTYGTAYTPSKNSIYNMGATIKVDKLWDGAVIPTDGLVFYAPLSSDTETAETGQSLYKYGTPTYVTTAGVPCCMFGGNSYITSTTNLNLNTSDFSFCAWVYVNVSGPGYAAYSSGECRLSTVSGNIWEITIGTNEIGRATASGAEPYNWYHTAIIRKNNVASLFVNHQEVCSSTDLQDYTVNFNDVMLGAWNGNKYPGGLADVRIYNRALDPEEVALLADNMP